MATNPKKPTGATGSPQAALRSPKATASQTKPANEVFVLDRSKKSLQDISFSKIVVRAKDYAFRDGYGSDPFSEVALKKLREEILEFGGIHTPILLRDLGNGTYLLVDGHGRYFTLKKLIADKVAGYTPDMLLPANVLAPETSELVAVATGISANTARRPLAYEGRLKAAKRLYELGMPKSAIARLLDIGESTLDRDLALAGDPEMMEFVRTHCITATSAASLLASANKHGRRAVLMTHFKEWIATTRAQIEAYVADLKAKDADLSVPLAKTWPQSYLTPQIIKAWRIALEKDQPLVDPGFRFRAMVRTDKGVKRIEVDGLNLVVEDMSAEDVAKVLQRCTDLAADLEPVLTAKMVEERDDETEGEVAKVSPGQQRLQQLGWSQFAGEADDDYDPDDDREPDHDPDEFAGPWGADGQPMVEP